MALAKNPKSDQLRALREMQAAASERMKPKKPLKKSGKKVRKKGTRR